MPRLARIALGVLVMTGAVMTAPLARAQAKPDDPKAQEELRRAFECAVDRVQNKEAREYVGVFNVYLENDLFANTDRDYTNGIKLSWVTPNLRDFVTDPCLPPWLRRLNGFFERVHPGEFTSRNMVVTFGQAMYTPVDRKRTDLIVNDRPYAGYLYLGLGYNARNDWQMDTIEVNLGVVGPAALAKQSQDFIHRLRGIERFQGWDNQLKNEGTIQFVYERKHKWFQDPPEKGFDVDLITHGGAALGNVAIYANAGAEFRMGWDIPDDFGTAPIRPAGDNNAPRRTEDRLSNVGKRGAHAFISVDGRAVARNIFLDGNTFRDSHSVDKKRLVGEAAVGFAANFGGSKISFARYFRSREFEQQQRAQRYGSITLSGEF